MTERICGKLNRCKFAKNCPHKQRPMVEYLCFERKFGTTTMKKRQEVKNDGR